MRGHLEARRRNTWRAKVYLGHDARTNKKRHLTRTIHGTKREAQDILNELLVEAGHGSHTIVDGTFGDLSQRWLSLASADLSPTTVAEYRRLLDKLILPRFAKSKVRSMTASDLDAFYAQLHRHGGNGGGPLGAQSIQHVHALVRRLLNQAVRWGWITVNPAANASPPRVVKAELSQIAPPEQVISLLAAAQERDPDFGCFLRLATVTGARRGELCALHWDDLDVRRGTLHISRGIVGNRNDELAEKSTKTHATRRISLDTETLSSLTLHRERCSEQAAACDATVDASGFMFSDEPDGATAWRPGRVTVAFGRLCRSLGIQHLRFHDLRHFAATQLLAAGVPVKTVSGRLGHANAATTLNVYAHFLESSDEDAAQKLAGVLISTASRTATSGTRRSG